GEGANESLRQCHAKDPEAIQSPTTATLTPMLERAESRLREGQRLREQRQGIYDRIAMLNQQRQRLTQNLEHARAKRAAWQREWAALTAELGLSPTATPADVSDHLESIAAILKLMDEVRNLETRIQGIDRDADQFVADTRALLETLAPDLLAVPVEVAVPRLHQRLIEQREASSRRSERRALANQTRLEISEIEAALQATEETLAELCRLAGCSDPESLPEVLERARERRRLTEDLQQVEAELIASGDGLDLAALEQEAQGVEIEAVVSELARIEHAVEQELQPRYTAVLERRIHAERDFSAMTGSDEAALLAEEIERTCAALCSRVKRYVRVCLAARILREAIEQFRQQHRNPLLASAGAYFAALTCQRFIAVDSDFDVADQSILVGVRANGERVRVESMSTGTRDQLYLALRLAHLDLHLAHAPPLPFIVDDILIQFDDERARATLEVLADLSNKTQVILFTHHGRVVEQAQALPAAEQRVFVQVLD
ncbi:MAG: ATP-binding protein, partial [Thermochromatium sp.]